MGIPDEPSTTIAHLARKILKSSQIHHLSASSADRWGQCAALVCFHAQMHRVTAEGGRYQPVIERREEKLTRAELCDDASRNPTLIWLARGMWGIPLEYSGEQGERDA